MEQKFIRESPPRDIDLYSQAVVILSGPLQQFGWGFFTFGMIFFWAFGMQSTVRNFSTPLGSSQTTNGTLQEISMTSASENEQRIYRYEYTYVLDFKEYEGKSFGYANAYSRGDEIPVVYSLKHPERSHIEGLRRSVFSGWVLFVVLFPLIGLVFVIQQVRKNIYYLRLLRYGTGSKGVMVNKEATGGSVTINEVEYPIYAYTFDFEVAGTAYKAKAKTHLTEKLEDEKEELILYDQLKPSENIVFDAMHGAIRIDQHGYLTSASPVKILLFVLPLLAILVNWLGYVLTSVM